MVSARQRLHTPAASREEVDDGLPRKPPYALSCTVLWHQQTSGTSHTRWLWVCCLHLFNGDSPVFGPRRVALW